MKKFLEWMAIIVLAAAAAYASLLIIYKFNLSYDLLHRGSWLHYAVTAVTFVVALGVVWAYRKIFTKVK